MLLNNLRKLKEVSRMTYEQIAEASKTPLSTVKRIFSGDCEPLASTLYRIVTSLGGSLDEILADTNVVLSPKTLAEVKETLEEVKETADAVEAERDHIADENVRLRVQVAEMSAKIELLEMQLKHKDELFELIRQHKDELRALHDFYGNRTSHN